MYVHEPPQGFATQVSSFTLNAYRLKMNTTISSNISELDDYPIRHSLRQWSEIRMRHAKPEIVGDACGPDLQNP
jgi:hypothetical protein